MNKRSQALIGVIAMAALVLFGTACATKKFVNTEMAGLDKKIEDVSLEVESSQKRIKEHDERLTTIGELINNQDAQLKQVDTKVEEVKGLVRGKLVDSVTLRTDDAKFGFNSAQLTPEAKAALDAFVQKLVAENKGVYLDIQGHTDSTGPQDYNVILGQKRAEAVRDYLYGQYHIPLHRMGVISLGSSQPVAENSSREGRAQNRRIEILVYG